MTGGSTVNKNKNNWNGNKKKEKSKDRIGEPDDGMVRGIPKQNLEPKGAKTGEAMVCNGKTY